MTDTATRHELIRAVSLAAAAAVLVIVGLLPWSWAHLVPADLVVGAVLVYLIVTVALLAAAVVAFVQVIRRALSRP